MRVAICFSGMPRNFKTTHKPFENNILNVLEGMGFEYDIFIHTWDNKLKYPKYLPDDGNYTEIERLYNPISFECEIYDNNMIHELLIDSKVDKYLQHLSSKGYTEWKRRSDDISEWIAGGLLRNNTISLFYGIKKVNELRKKYEKENNFKYDAIILCRFDNIVFDKINTNVLEVLEDTIFSPMGYEPDDRDKLGTVNDILAVGGRDSMEVYMTLYDRMYYLLKKRFDYKHPRPFHTIGLTKHNLVDKNININRFYLNHIVCRRLHKYKALNSVVTGEGWDIPVHKTTEIIKESNNWM